MNNRCKHLEDDGFHVCGSYAFNLYRENIKQGDLCDTHYWEEKCASVLASLAASEDKIKALREALVNLAHSCEKSRIWGGMEWVYHPVHPIHYLPALEQARAVLQKGQKE